MERAGYGGSNSPAQASFIAAKSVPVGEEEREFHDRCARTAGGFDDCNEVHNDSSRLLADPAGDEGTGRWIDRDLTRDVGVSPARTACEYGPAADGARSVEIAARFMINLSSPFAMSP